MNTFEQIQTAIRDALIANEYFSPTDAKRGIPVVLEDDNDIEAEITQHLLSLGLGVIVLPPLPGAAVSGTRGPLYTDCAAYIDVVENPTLNRNGGSGERGHTVCDAVENILHNSPLAGVQICLSFAGRERYDGELKNKMGAVTVHRIRFDFDDALNEMPKRS